MKTFALLILYVGTFAFFAGCSDGYDLGYGSTTREVVVDDQGGMVVVDADGTEDGVSVDKNFNGQSPHPSVTPPKEKPGDGDGDGIDDGEDNLPESCTELVVTSNGTSSARIWLNGEELFGPSDFHNKDIVLREHVNLHEGSNRLAMRIAGSPGDQLLVQIYNCSVEPADLLYDLTLTRTTGKPNKAAGKF